MYLTIHMYVFHMYYVYDVFDDSHYIQKTVPAKCTLTGSLYLSLTPKFKT